MGQDGGNGRSRVAGVGGLSASANQSLRAFVERVFANFRDKNGAFYNGVNICSFWLSLKALRKQDGFRWTSATLDMISEWHRTAMQFDHTLLCLVIIIDTETDEPRCLKSEPGELWWGREGRRAHCGCEDGTLVQRWANTTMQSCDWQPVLVQILLSALFSNITHCTLFPVPVKSGGKWLPVENVFSTLQDIWQETERLGVENTGFKLCFHHLLRTGPVAEDDRVSYLTATRR